MLKASLLVRVGDQPGAAASTRPADDADDGLHLHFALGEAHASPPAAPCSARPMQVSGVVSVEEIRQLLALLGRVLENVDKIED